MSRAAIPSPPALILTVRTAEELMSPNPVSLRQDASIAEAIDALIERGYSAAPVIDEAGRPVGVLSRTDILVHHREEVRQIRTNSASNVGDLMTPTVFTVSTSTPAADVVRRMCEWKVRQLFVVDEHNALIGVVSALDIVRHLTRQT